MFCLLLLSQFSFSLKELSHKPVKADDGGYTTHDRIDDQDQPITLEMNLFANLGDLEAGNGGGILISKKKVNCVLNNCKFDTCRGTNGGAIYIMYSGSASTYSCAISASTFVGCESKTHGGAIFVQITQSHTHSIAITNSEFSNNVAGQEGGAIYAMVRDSCTIQHCVFNGNKGGEKGSSIWCRVGWNDRYNTNNLIIEDNTFMFTPTSKKSTNVYIDTYVLSGDTTPNANLILGRCSFGPASTQFAGYKQLEISEQNSHFESIKFTGCNCVDDIYGTVSLPYSYNPNATFAFNCKDIGSCQLQPVPPTSAPTQDGEGFSIYPERIYLSYSLNPPSLKLIKAKFSNFEYLKNDIGGGAVAIDRVDCTITGSNFEHCYTSAKNFGGGAVYVSYTGTGASYTCYISNTVFSNCNVSNNGGALYIQTLQPDIHRISVDGCTFLSNVASKLGGAVFASSRDLISICHCTFKDNNAATGASLYAKVGHANGKDTNDRLTLYGNTFDFTPTEEHNINVYIEIIALQQDIEPRAVIYLGSNSFIKNGEVTTYYSLFVDPKGQLKEFIFIGCNCIQSGMNTVSIPSTVEGVTQNIIPDCPGINQCPEQELPSPTSECSIFSHRLDQNSNLDIRNTCFVDLVSPIDFDGGAVRVTNAPLVLQSCHIKHCSSSRNGGAVFAFNSGNNCNLNIEGCIFELCSAGAKGGAIYYFSEIPTSSSIQNNKFFNNEAVEDGGALYYSPSGSSTLSQNFFLNNSCTKSNTHGTHVYALIRNLHTNINNDQVVISNNRFRSQLAPNSQQLYLNLKKTGRLQLGENSFSFNKANITSISSKYVYLSIDEGADFQVTGEICVDSDVARPGIVYGFDNNIVYDCHQADEEWDNYVEPTPEVKEKEFNLGLAIGIAVIVGVVIIGIVIAILVVITIKERRNQ